MRTLILGDIHGNLPALEKVLTMEKDVDQIICHGDVVNYGPWSNECVRVLSELRNCICLKGNHEEYFLSGAYGGSNQLVKEFFKFCFERFKEKKTIQLYDESVSTGEFLVQHTIFNRYIFLDSEVPSLDRNYIIGHSHQQFKREISGHTLINTGSLGQNREFINMANYIIYEDSQRNISLKNFTYDIDLVIKEMKSQGYPSDCVNYYTSKRRL